jgi:hypothetical protein
MKFGEDLFNNELRPAPSVAAIRPFSAEFHAHSANDRFAPQGVVDLAKLASGLTLAVSNLRNL